MIVQIYKLQILTVMVYTQDNSGSNIFPRIPQMKPLMPLICVICEKISDICGKHFFRFEEFLFLACPAALRGSIQDSGKQKGF